MTWPSPPGGDRQDGTSQPDAEQPAPSPWRPAPSPSSPGPDQGTGDGADAGVPPTAGRPRGGRKVVPIAAGAVGVVALGVAGWLAVSQGLIPGLGAGGGSAADDRLADITGEPSEAWSYTYLPRSGEATLGGRQVEGDAAYFLVAEGGYEDQSWTLTRLDLDEGEEAWAVDLDLELGDADSSSSLTFDGVIGDRVFLGESTYEVDPDTYDSFMTNVQHILDARTGETVETVDTGEARWWVAGSELYQVDDDELSRLDPADPSAEPMWSTVTGQEITGVYNWNDTDYVTTSSYEEANEWYAVADGEVPEWFEPGENYDIVDGQVYRREYGERGSTLERLEDDGSVQWTIDADSFDVRSTPSGGVAIFAMDRSAGSSGGPSYEYLERIDPRNGERMWDEGVEADFDWVGSIVGDTVELKDSAAGRSELYSLDDGDRLARLRGSSTTAGVRTFYLVDDGELSAVDDEGEELWSVRARGASGLFSAPGYLITEDSEAGRLTRWE